MQSTKEQILSHLKRSGDVTVDGLAGAFGLARMTVRQHLSALERDGFVVSREERQRTGRPHLVFCLSEQGQERFPKRYDRFADLALQEVSFLDAEEIAGLSAGDKKRLLLAKMADRVYQQHAARVTGKPLDARVVAVANILQEEGGFAEWTASGPQYEIVDYNCVYQRVAESHHDVCDWHVQLLGRLLGQEVQCSQFMSEGADCCRFVVSPEDSEQAAQKRESRWVKTQTAR
jgi:DeoR family transcriptional regulator, suf operon transcriptional repressor